MTVENLREMSSSGLIDLFVTIALAQDEAILMDEHDEYNRLYLRMRAIAGELKSRPGDERSALAKLYEHPNAQVRLQAAIDTLAVAPEAASRALRLISDRQEYPQAADARGMLNALAEGSYVPE
jgi:hypothetical protein